MNAWALAAMTALVAALGAEATRRFALRRALLDLPGPRRSHAVPTPRGGGLGIVLALLLVTPLLPGATVTLAPFLAALLAVAAIGTFDDLRPLPPGPRIAVHAAAGALIAAGYVDGGGFPALLVPGAVVTLVVVAAINVWNFMDGIDTLATTQALLIALALALVPGLAPADPAWSGLALAVAAAAAGFIGFNLPPARLFLGDVGSGALGLVVAVLLLHAVAAGLPWPLALILPSAFLADAGLTLASRLLRRERWWRPHREHLYQWAVRAGHGHGVVSLGYGAWTLAMMGLGAPLREAGPPARYALLFGVYAFAAIIWLVLIGRFRERARRHNA